MRSLHSVRCTLRTVRRVLSATFILSCIFFNFRLDLEAQPALTIANPFTSVSVVQDQKAGRFWFATGAQYEYTRYLYHGAKTATTITSNVVFRVKRGNEVHYFCNTPDNFANGGVRPQGPAGPALFLPYDSVRVTPDGDTLEVIWLEVDQLYDITMRFVAELPRNPYDDGADILLEFDYRRSRPAPTGSDLGIFLMLDGDNGTLRDVSVASDRSSIISDRGYYSSQLYGKVFSGGPGNVPQHYMIGWFKYANPLDSVLPVHRLSGTSLGGTPLTTPHLFAVGNWKDFRSLAWDINADVGSTQIGDMATAVRWENLGSEGIVRTAFGTTSRKGNNLYHCRDTGVFVHARTVRAVQQSSLGEPYSPAEFDLEMWVTNTHETDIIRPQLTIPEPFTFEPSNTSIMRIDPSTPILQGATLAPGETKKLVWRLVVDSISTDTLVSIPILYRDSTRGIRSFRPLLDGGTMHVSFFTPLSPSRDVAAPVVTMTGGGARSEWRSWDLYDRHGAVSFDTGIDTIEIVRNDNDNAELIFNPARFEKCDPSETISLECRVRDTTKRAVVAFALFDCAGNRTFDSMTYRPRPDIHAPEVVRIDSVGRPKPREFPCAVPVFEVYLRDDAHLTDTTSDAGFGRIDVLTSENFFPPEINFSSGGGPIEPLSPRISLRLAVIDTTIEGSIAIRVADFAGNADTLEFAYCPIPGTSSVAGDELLGRHGPMIIRYVSPQPFRSGAGMTLHIGVENAGRASVIEIVSVVGHVLARRVFDDVGFDHWNGVVRFPFELTGGLPSGVYQVRVISNGGSATAKVVATD